MDKEHTNDLSNVVNLDEAVIPLRLSHEMVDRIAKKAQFSGYPSVETYCVSIIVNSLTTKIGEATISTPSQVSNTETKKITGPSNSGMVTRA